LISRWLHSSSSSVSLAGYLQETWIDFDHLSGGPGSGKSTIGANLSADLGFIQINPNEIVKRLRVQGPEEAWLAVESAMDDNGVVPDDMLSVLLKMEVSMHLEASEGVFLIEDFPRSYKQFEEFSSVRELNPRSETVLTTSLAL
jgi:adenylate kinase family enzyme